LMKSVQYNIEDEYAEVCLPLRDELPKKY